MEKHISITKIIKQGFGRKINSELGYASFEIAPTTIEFTFDPPIDITTPEGKDTYDKVKEKIRIASMHILEEDIAYYASRVPELKISLERKDEKVQKALKEGI
jgi:hypothetical protein